MNLILSSLALAALAQATYPITGTTVNCRAGPTTDSAIVKTYKRDDRVSIACQAQGPDINGNTIWDRTADGCYVSDYFVKTGTSKYVADKCAGSSATASAAVPTASRGSNSTVVPTGSATSTGGPAVSTTPVPARAAGLDVVLAAYVALPLVLLGLA